MQEYRVYALVLLSILASGYLYQSQHPLRKYKLHRFIGQQLYLKTSAFGLLFFIISFSLIYVLYKLVGYSPVLYNYLHNKVLDLGNFNKFDVFLFLSSLFMFFFAPIAASLKKKILMNKMEKRANIVAEIIKRKKPYNIKVLTKQFHMQKVFSDSPLDQLLITSQIQDNKLMITLNDRKVYIGYVSKMGEPTENNGLDQEIEIYPVASGYRDKETLEFNLTTHYLEDENIALTIKQNSILSATKYSALAYRRHKNRRKLSQ